MTKPEAARLVALLKAAWPRQELAPETIRLYAEMLVDLDADAAGAAVREAMTSSRFFPSIAEIRQLVAERHANLPPAAEAWEEVVRGMRQASYDCQGWRDYPRWTCEPIKRAVDAIGLYELCNTDNLPTVRAQWLRLYEQFRAEAVARIQRGAIAARPERPQLPAPAPRRELGEPHGTMTFAEIGRGLLEALNKPGAA